MDGSTLLQSQVGHGQCWNCLGLGDKKKRVTNVRHCEVERWQAHRQASQVHMAVCGQDRTPSLGMLDHSCMRDLAAFRIVTQGCSLHHKKLGKKGTWAGSSCSRTDSKCCQLPRWLMGSTSASVSHIPCIVSWDKMLWVQYLFNENLLIKLWL